MPDTDKILDAIAFYTANGITHCTSGNRHCTPGWVQTDCPICNGTNMQMGYNMRMGYYRCWRCGAHRVWDVVGAFLQTDWRAARTACASFLRDSDAVVRRDDDKPAVVAKSGRVTLELPYKSRRLRREHRAYLRKRKFDPFLLQDLWGLVGTGPVSLQGYENRIVAPIMLKGRLVSYQARDITGTSIIPYRACAKKLELVHHKHILYGMDFIGASNQVLVVEGITKAWRMGPGSVATFGTSWTDEQVECLRKYGRRVIMFDGGPGEGAARRLARRLAEVLSLYPGKTELVDVECDPADLPQREADTIMRQLGFR